MMHVDFGGTGKGDPDWITVNVDPGIAHPAPHVLADITAERHQLNAHFLPHSIDEAQCIATLEHLPPYDLMPTLAYWREFLRADARLLIVVPDMPRICRDYIDGLIPDETFMGIVYGPPDWQKLTPGEAHRWGFSADMLIAALCEAGYHDVRQTIWDGVGWKVDGIHLHDLVVEAFA